MSDEAEVLLLPGLPLVNLPGENPEPDFWSFELETPRASSVATTSPPVTIDYVHPGNMGLLFVSTSMYALPPEWSLLIGFLTMDLSVPTEWSAIFRDDDWRQFTETKTRAQSDGNDCAGQAC